MTVARRQRIEQKAYRNAMLKTISKAMAEEERIREKAAEQSDWLEIWHDANINIARLAQAAAVVMYGPENKTGR